MLRPGERTILSELLSGHTALPHRIISMSMDKAVSKARLCKELGISDASCAKNVTLAKDILLQIVKENRHNQYDDILIVQYLHLDGLDNLALKEYNQLVKKYEQMQLYGPLDILHHEAIRIHYATCDLKEIKKVNVKINENADKLAAYTKLDKKIIYEMAVLEKGDIKINSISAYEKKLKALHAEALAMGHHVLAFNTFHCLYELYTRYEISLPKASNIVAQLLAHVTRYRDKMAKHTYLVGLYNIVNFRSIYCADKSPVGLDKVVFPMLVHYRETLKLSTYVAFMIYYFSVGDKKAFDLLYKDLLSIAIIEEHNSYLMHLMACLHSFMHGDSAAFREHLQLFYQSVKNRSYPDYELMIRHLETYIFLEEKQYDLCMDRIKATSIFIRRNFTTQRFTEESRLLALYRAKLANKKIQPETDFTLRFNKHMAEKIVALK